MIQIIIGWALGFLIAKNMQWNKQENKLFLISLLSYLLWLTLATLARTSLVQSSYYINILIRIDFFVASIFPITFFLFTEKYKGVKTINKLHIISLIILTLLSSQIIEKININNSTEEKEIFILFQKTFLIYIIIFLTYLLKSIKNIFSIYKTNKGIKKIISKHLLIGIISSGVINVTHSFILPLFEKQNITTAYISHISTLFFLLFTAYAVIKYRFLDIRVIIKGKKKTYDLSKAVDHINFTMKNDREIKMLGKVIQREIENAFEVKGVRFISTATTTQKKELELIEQIATHSTEKVIVTQEITARYESTKQWRTTHQLLEKTNTGIVVQLYDPQKTLIIIPPKPNNRLFSKTELDGLDKRASQITLALRYALLYQQTQHRIDKQKKANNNNNNQENKIKKGDHNHNDHNNDK